MHEQQPCSLSSLHSETTVPPILITKIPKSYYCRKSSLPVTVNQPESSDLRGWEGAVKAPRHSVVSAQMGMQPRRFKRRDELSTWNAIVLLTCPEYHSFPTLTCFFSHSTNSTNAPFFRERESLLSSLNAAVGKGGNCFTCQWQTDKKQRLSHVVSQAGLQRDSTL